MFGNGKEIKFKYLQDFIDYGEEKLFEQFLDVYEEIPEGKYIIKYVSIRDEIKKLLDYQANDDEQELINSDTSNIFNMARLLFSQLYNDTTSFESFTKNIFKGYYGDKEMRINIENSNDEFKITIWSISGGCGTGYSIDFYLVDKNKLKNAIDEVYMLDIPKCLKDKYITYLNEQHWNSRVTLQDAIEDVACGLINSIDGYVYENSDLMEQYDSLRKQNIKDSLIEYLKKNDYVKDIMECIDVKWKTYKASSYDEIIRGVGKEGDILEEDNCLLICLNGEKIKEIKKVTHTTYEICSHNDKKYKN